MGAHRDRDQMQAELADLLQNIGEQYQAMHLAREKAQRTSASLTAMDSYNGNILGSATKLGLDIPDLIDQIMTQYRIVLVSLEDYKTGL